MSRSGTVRIYEALLVLYPRRFRREYGEDMAQLFAEQLRDENAWRVCSRAATDLALTVPTRYLEVIMKTSASLLLSTLLGAVAVAGILFALVSGTNAVLAIAGAATAVLAGGLSLVSYHRNRPLAPSTTAHGWWRLLMGGAGLLTALIVTVNLTGEVPEDFWLPTMIAGLTAIVLMAMGLILGVIQLTTRGARHASAG
jgi:hypothetical protein